MTVVMATGVCLTLGKDGQQRVLEVLFGLFYFILVLCLLVHQTPHLTVGRLDHGIEMIGCPPVHLASFYPCRQNCYDLTELAVICIRDTLKR